MYNCIDNFFQIFEKNYYSYRCFRILTLISLFSIMFLIGIYHSSYTEVIDSDSGFEYTNAQNLLINNRLEHGPIIQQIINAVILGIFGLNFRNLLVFQSLLNAIVVLVTFHFIKRRTGIVSAIISSFLFLFFNNFYWSNYVIKQYPLFLLFLLVSINFFDIYLNHRGKKSLCFSAIFLGLGLMTHMLCLPFVALVFLYYLFSKILQDNSLKSNELLIYYLTLFLTILPYLFWRISIDGFSLNTLLTYPAKWGTIKYGKMVNLEFWQMTPPFTFGYYFNIISLLINSAFIPTLIPLYTIGFLQFNRKKLVVCWLLVFLIPYFFGRGIFTLKYGFPLMPLAVILSAQGINTFLTQGIKIKKFYNTVIILLLALSILHCVYLSSLFNNYSNKYDSSVKDFKDFNSIIPVGSYILFRSRLPSPYFPQKNVLEIQDLLEEDAIIYLDWQSDEEVMKVFNKYNISFVILYKEIRWENDYHVWFKAITEHEPSHYIMIEESTNFKKIKDGNNFILYTLK